MSVTLIDTNVIVYAHSIQSEDKRKVSITCLEELKESGAGAISTQVLAETFVALRRLLILVLGDDRAATKISENITRDYAGSFPVLQISGDDVLAASKAVSKHGMSFWDALLWACARSHGVENILSEDGPAGVKVEGVRYINPFLKR